ncbi:MAG: hypothetical protein JSU00_02435 [Acidobacteria bacterium]|nr:hypothetical protein [Acidobacteriota bacterium]
MNSQLRRSKMITFRVSREEYEQVRSACLRRGMRSVSAFARTAVERMMNAKSDSSMNDELQDLRAQVHALTLRVEEIARAANPTRREPDSPVLGLPA